MKQVEAKVLTVEEQKVNKEFQKELKRIKECDAEIDKQLTHKGESLIRIRDEKLYRIRYKNFEEAVSGELGLSRQEGYRLIDDVATVKALKLSPKGDKIIQEMDLKTHHIRALAANTDDAEDQVKVLEHIQQRQLPVTAKVIEQVADEILPPKIEPEVERPRDKRTEFNPGEFDAAYEAPEPVQSVHPSRTTFEAQFGKVRGQIQAAFDGLGPLVRMLDDCDGAGAVNNHNHLMEQHRLLYKHIDAAVGVLKVYGKAWGSSQ